MPKGIPNKTGREEFIKDLSREILLNIVILKKQSNPDLSDEAYKLAERLADLLKL